MRTNNISKNKNDRQIGVQSAAVAVRLLKTLAELQGPQTLEEFMSQALVVAVIGAITAFYAATIGLVQTDIKRILAYSTISQIGYMVMACGVAAFSVYEGGKYDIYTLDLGEGGRFPAVLAFGRLGF